MDDKQREHFQLTQLGGVIHAMGTNSQACLRPCLECGLYTGGYCETLAQAKAGPKGTWQGGTCFAAEVYPWRKGMDAKEKWTAGQRTPLCTSCEIRYGACRACRGVSGCTPPYKGSPIPVPGCSDGVYDADTLKGPLPVSQSSVRQGVPNGVVFPVQEGLGSRPTPTHANPTRRTSPVEVKNDALRKRKTTARDAPQGSAQPGDTTTDNEWAWNEELAWNEIADWEFRRTIEAWPEGTLPHEDQLRMIYANWLQERPHMAPTPEPTDALELALTVAKQLETGPVLGGPTGTTIYWPTGPHDWPIRTSERPTGPHDS